jgi:HEAT repeat protein
MLLLRSNLESQALNSCPALMAAMTLSWLLCSVTGAGADEVPSEPPVAEAPQGDSGEGASAAATPAPKATPRPPSRLKDGVWDARPRNPRKRADPREPIEPRPEVAEEYERVLLVLTTAENPDERSRAAMKLAQLAPKAAVRPLVTALEDPEPTVVINVMYALQFTRRSVAIPPILKMQGHPDPRVRDAVSKIIKASQPTMSVR